MKSRNITVSNELIEDSYLVNEFINSRLSNTKTTELDRESQLRNQVLEYREEISRYENLLEMAEEELKNYDAT